jgi:serine/threonine protein kinase
MTRRDCPSAEQLSAYVKGLLSRPRIEAIADHLEQCRPCREALKGMTSVPGTLLPNLPGPVPTTGAPVNSPVLPGDPKGPPIAAPDVPAMKLGMHLPGVGQQLDQYEIQAKLGEGGMGVVYKAWHRRLEKPVALKVLPAQAMTDPEAVARFQREMKAVGRLDHPHIVRALDAREVEGLHCLIMEFVEGVDLAALVTRSGVLPVASACELVRQAALGLQHAFEHGLVHRDVKPSNLMLAHDGRVKVLDLGLARLHAAEAEADLTGFGQLMGTLDYMAPEQASDARAVDVRADVYSLGCTLYHFLAGRPPFSGPEFSRALNKVFGHREVAVPPVTNFRPEVPKALVRILERMLAKKPADRFATPAEVALALAPFTSGANLAALLAVHAPTADPDAPPNRASTVNQRGTDTVDGKAGQHGPARFRRWTAAAALLLAGVLVVAAAWRIAPFGKAPQPPAAPPQKAERAQVPEEKEPGLPPPQPRAARFWFAWAGCPGSEERARAGRRTIGYPYNGGAGPRCPQDLLPSLPSWRGLRGRRLRRPSD